MTAYAGVIRSVMLAHPWFADLPPRARLAVTPRRIALVEKAMVSLERPGTDIDAIMLIVGHGGSVCRRRDRSRTRSTAIHGR